MKTMCQWRMIGLMFAAAAVPAGGAIVSFDLLGKAGPGLLGGNENGAIVNPGSGGEFGEGVYFDTDDSRLYVLVAWGSENGFTDLSGAATMQHIHGPTTGAGTESFVENAGVLFGLNPLAFVVDPSATGGSINGSAPLTPPQVTDLMAGRYYINVHTAANPGGEIRGNLVVVPEPTAAWLIPGAALAGMRRRRGMC